VNRVRGITVTRRAAIDVRDSRLGSGTIKAESNGRELGLAGDAEETQIFKLEKASLVKVAASTMYEVTAGASGSRKENMIGVKNREPSKTMKADEVDVEAGRMTSEVTRGRESKVEAGVDN
jgi:hypothetical protein